MKKLLFIIIFLQSFHLLKAQSPTLHWVSNTSGTSDEVGNSVAVDIEGNVYTTGAYKGTVDFDPGIGVFNLSSKGGTDVFISKFDITGNLVWAKSIGGTLNEEGNSIGVDASGNVFVVGVFAGTADFDPNSGTTNLTSVGYSDIFIVKLITSGDLVFAKRIGGDGYDNGYSLAVDAFGNFYATGYFTSTVDFDPNSGVVNFSSTSSSRDVFITKFDGEGNLVWAKKIGGDQEDVGYSIAISEQGNVYTTGSFLGTTDFNPNAAQFNMTSAGSYDLFVINLDALGNFVWAKKIGGASYDASSGIAVDSDGNSYITGTFSGTVDFDPNVGTQNLTTTLAGVFTLKLDISGNFVWAKSLEGNNIGSFAIAVDGSGNVYNTGYFYQTIDFDPNASTYNLTALQADVFISKVDNAGNLSFAIKIGGTGDDYGHALTTDASGNLYAAGRFQSTVDFDPSVGTSNLTSAGYYDMFVIKLGPCIEPLAPSVSDAIICSDNSTNLSATGVGTLGWYSASSGGTYLGGESNFSTPTLSETTSFYVQDSTCTSSSRTEVKVVVSTCTGINQITSTPLANISPNPSSGTLTINTSNVADFILITDAVGQTILEIKPTTTNIFIDINHFKNGIYFIRVETVGKSSVYKIIKE